MKVTNPTFRRKIVRRGKSTQSKLVKKLDTVFSQWIRLSAGKRIKCFTCPVVKDYKNMQCGHYISREVKGLRWNEDNCRPQCYGCNIMHSGRSVDFRENLVRDMGEARVKELEQMRFILFRPTEEYLTTLIALYEERLRELGA